MRQEKQLSAMAAVSRGRREDAQRGQLRKAKSGGVVNTWELLRSEREKVPVGTISTSVFSGILALMPYIFSGMVALKLCRCHVHQLHCLDFEPNGQKSPKYKSDSHNQAAVSQ